MIKGTFGDKAATLDRFRGAYATLQPTIKARLVLENDELCYNVDDLLPICEELIIPIVVRVFIRRTPQRSNLRYSLTIIMIG